MIIAILVISNAVQPLPPLEPTDLRTQQRIELIAAAEEMEADFDDADEPLPRPHERCNFQQQIDTISTKPIEYEFP